MFSTIRDLDSVPDLPTELLAYKKYTTPTSPVVTIFARSKLAIGLDCLRKKCLGGNNVLGDLVGK